MLIIVTMTCHRLEHLIWLSYDDYIITIVDQNPVRLSYSNCLEVFFDQLRHCLRVQLQVAVSQETKNVPLVRKLKVVFEILCQIQPGRVGKVTCDGDTHILEALSDLWAKYHLCFALKKPHFAV